MAILLCGIALTAGLAWTASSANGENQQRLLKLQVEQAASTITASLPSVQSQLADALQVVTDTHSLTAFERFTSQKVSAATGFVSISLWQDSARGVLTLQDVVGAKPMLLVDGIASAFLLHLRPTTTLQVTPILRGSPARLGYAVTAPGKGGYIVYAESNLPKDRRLIIPPSSAFKDLNFALYLGSQPQFAELLVATELPPIPQPNASATVPFGDISILLVATATSSLTGGISTNLSWIVLLLGAALTLTAAVIVEYVARRRQFAELLATENERLYVEQRDIARDLQHALLPTVPEVENLEIAARYEPGVAGIEVGGDWYDVICRSDDVCVFAVGDVSGRGLRAAATMAFLRFATRAYVAEGDDPDTILTKLDSLIDFETDQQFATVLIGEIDTRKGRLMLASAGHLPPLLVAEGTASFVEVPLSPPVGLGVRRGATATVAIPSAGTLLAITDGLVERRHEHLDTGLERFREQAARAEGSVKEMVDQLVTGLLPTGGTDDVVVLGLRWQS